MGNVHPLPGTLPESSSCWVKADSAIYGSNELIRVFTRRHRFAATSQVDAQAIRELLQFEFNRLLIALERYHIKMNAIRIAELIVVARQIF